MLNDRVSLKRPAHILVLLVMGGILLGIPMCSFLAYRDRAPRVEAWGENLATDALAAVKRPAKAAPRAVSAQEATSSPQVEPRLAMPPGDVLQPLPEKAAPKAAPRAAPAPVKEAAKAPAQSVGLRITDSDELQAIVTARHYMRKCVAPRSAKLSSSFCPVERFVVTDDGGMCGVVGLVRTENDFGTLMPFEYRMAMVKVGEKKEFASWVVVDVQLIPQ